MGGWGRLAIAVHFVFTEYKQSKKKVTVGRSTIFHPPSPHP